VADIGLTELQLEIMDVLWRRREATVGEVHEAMGVARGLAQATIATLLRRLEKKGAVAHRLDGRQFVYRAVVTSKAAKQSMVAEVADRLFPDQVPALISYLLAEKKIGAAELEEVKALIKAKEREAKGRRT
jgi:predicted transcriptional regulator